MASWQEKGLPLKTIAINFSSKQLQDGGYIDFLKEKLRKKEIAPELIEIEITESILLEKEQQAIEFLSALKDLGVKIALDDFGTGYSALNYLTYIELDRIKLDKSLNDKFLQDKESKTMDNLIGLFHSLNLPIVVEGIETKEQYQILKAKDCDYIQGYLFSKPVAAKKIKAKYDKNYIKELGNE